MGLLEEIIFKSSEEDTRRVQQVDAVGLSWMAIQKLVEETGASEQDLEDYLTLPYYIIPNVNEVFYKFIYF